MAGREEEPGITFTISGIKERVVVYGFALLVGGASVLNLATPWGRADPNTGAQGRARDAQLVEHKQLLEAIDDRLEYVELAIQLIESNDGNCRKRQDVFERKLDRHLQYSESKVESIEKRFAEVIADNRVQDRQIADCMRRTQ